MLPTLTLMLGSVLLLLSAVVLLVRLTEMPLPEMATEMSGRGGMGGSGPGPCAATTPDGQRVKVQLNKVIRRL